MVNPDGRAMVGSSAALPDLRSGLNGGLGWLEVECNRCKTRASIPLDAIWRPRDLPLWKLEARDWNAVPAGTACMRHLCTRTRSR